MAMTLSELQTLLDELDLRYQAVPDQQLIMVGFAIDPKESPYRDRDGDPMVALAIRLTEDDGEFLSIFAPMAWALGETPHRAAVAEALVEIQSRFKIVRFDLVQGTIFPNVEIPLEDGRVTADQLQRVIGAILEVIKTFHVVVTRAINTGTISFDDGKAANEEDEALESAESAVGEIGRLLDLVDEVGGMDVGGLDALERLLGGDGGPPVES